MSRNYIHQIIRHIIRIIILTPLTIFGLFLFLRGFFIVFEDFLAGLLSIGIGLFITYQLGKITFQSTIGLFTEKNKKLNYKDAHIVKSRNVTFNAGSTFYSFYIASDIEGINYIVTSDFNKYIHKNGYGFYKIGIQEDAQFTKNIISSGGTMDIIEIYSIHKKED